MSDLVGEVTLLQHLHDERVDVESLRLSTAMWIALLRDMLA